MHSCGGWLYLLRSGDLKAQSPRLFSVRCELCGDAQAFTCMESYRMMKMTVTLHESTSPGVKINKEAVAGC